ncbi:transcriptional regulator family: Fungal Specific TF [Penicillium roqueforti]|nr:transcriptional regulator family: Fungal Specific TF [Penicillium roqueforti]KAI2704384.1 transcriptional regulator family: Fungal Specific TF [Penicillium roqueforti]KAI3155770.1 transcriptional regulator family: Fungal Specific TF [Penicillium roqueforti]KAI3265393.1 transcriptional regulator family: Fungal Specific TF [Penicillium roqueforti]
MHRKSLRTFFYFIVDIPNKESLPRYHNSRNSSATLVRIRSMKVAQQLPDCNREADMSNSKPERGSRGRYARLLCQGCRSRKIKCNLPDINELGPLGSPQPPEKSCERCRSLGLGCVIERSTLGRPSFKRGENESGRKSNSAHCHSATQNEQPGNSLIKDYSPSESTTSPETTQEIRAVADKTVFESVIEFQHFFASALGKDRIFGATIPRSTSGCMTPLPELVSHEIASSLDKDLAWYRFFIPGLPSLVDIRDRLKGDDELNIGTNLLFALLCLISCDTTGKFDRLHPRLKWNLQLAISSYGQEFIFSPPTHCDSVVVCIILADYRPTTVGVSQHTAHRAIKSTLYLNIAFKVAEKLEMLPSQLNLSFADIPSMSDEEFEHRITDSLQGMKIFTQDIILDGLLSRPVHQLQEALDRMAPHIHVYQNVFRHRPCSPRIIFQIQWATASYMLLESLKATKQNWTNPQRLCHVVDETEQKCLEQIRFCDWALSNTTQSGPPEEVRAARSLLEYRFHAVIGRSYGIALLHIMILRSRASNSSFSSDSDINIQEASQMGAKLSDALSNTSDDLGVQIVTFISRFGRPFPDRLLAVLEMFIKCTDLKLDGIQFQAPFRDIVLDILAFSRSIVENNSINVKNLTGKMRENADHQVLVLAECAKRLGNMVASPGKSIEAAFAGGCVFAASTKVMMAFIDIMRDLKKESDLGKAGPVPLTVSDGSAEGPSMSTFEDNSLDSGNLWSTEPIPNSFSAEDFVFDWSTIMDFDENMLYNDLNFDFGSC